MIATTLSSKNQITLPKFLLDMLSIQSGDTLLVSAKEETINIRPIKKDIVSMLAGSIKVPKSKMGVPFEKAMAIANEIAAKKTAQE